MDLLIPRANGEVVILEEVDPDESIDSIVQQVMDVNLKALVLEAQCGETPDAQGVAGSGAALAVLMIVNASPSRAL